MKKFLTLTLFLFCSLGLCAQSNFVPARIVKSPGDTLSGFVDNRDWRQNPRVVRYKGADGVVSEYRPINVTGFYLDETKEWYRSAILAVDKSSLKDTDVLDGVDQRGVKTDTVFLRTLIKGRLSLYYLYDESARGHYVAEKGGQFKELWIQKARVINTANPSAGVATTYHYRTQLEAYAADCSTPQSASKLE